MCVWSLESLKTGQHSSLSQAVARAINVMLKHTMTMAGVAPSAMLSINHRKSPNREADESVLRQQTPLVPASITAEILLPREFRHHACTVAPFCNDVFAATPRGASLLQDSRDTLVMALPTKYSRGPQCTGATADRNTSIIVSPPGLYTNTDCAGLLTLDTQALLSFSV